MFGKVVIAYGGAAQTTEKLAVRRSPDLMYTYASRYVSKTTRLR
jgi:hypothetical protein